VIDISTLTASLRQTVWLRQRSFGWANRANKRLLKMDLKLEDAADIDIHQATEYIRLYLQVEANKLLRDFGEDAVLIDSNNAPLTYQVFRSSEAISLLLGGEGGAD